MRIRLITTENDVAIMQLPTPQSLGRANRKARSYHAEIHRLRAAGYTFDVIRQALHDVGIDVSITTVWRESVKALPSTTRSEPLGTTTTSKYGNCPPASPSVNSAESSQSIATHGPMRSTVHGRDIAESFFAANPSNPLLSSKERP